MSSVCASLAVSISPNSYPINKELLLSILEHQRRLGMKNQDLCGDLPNEKALGICWNLKNDTFSFNLKLDTTTLTKRVMVSMISSIYDPLGFAAPFILEGRRILQVLCNQSIKWDNEVTSDVKKDWKKWLVKLKHIEQLHVRRCIKPDNFGKRVNVSLHHFSHASELGCGQCSYIRMVDEKGRVHCSLLLEKSRVVPKKFISIPRLELNAAVLSVKMVCLLKKDLNLGEVDEWFWTDSRVVLGYIKNDVRRFKTFVANRTQQIRENTEVRQWQYVPTRENPADDVSRSLNAERVDSGSCWFQGPPFP